MFACEHAGITPDLLCVAKGITGGYLPLAATLATEDVFEAFLAPYEDFKAFFHGHTYTGNPLACAVALASLRVFEEERTLERLGAKIATLEARLAAEVAPLAHVGDVRQRDQLVGALERLHLRLRCDVVVVFDGADVVGVAPRRTRGVRVVFSPAGESADPVVIREVAALPIRVPVVVASSDGWVRDHAVGEGATPVAAATLLDVLRR